MDKVVRGQEGKVARQVGGKADLDQRGQDLQEVVEHQIVADDVGHPPIYKLPVNLRKVLWIGQITGYWKQFD